MGTVSEQTVHTISAACEVIWRGREAHSDDDDFSGERGLIPILIPRSRSGDVRVFRFPKYRGSVGDGIFTEQVNGTGRAISVVCASVCPSGQ